MGTMAAYQQDVDVELQRLRDLGDSQLTEQDNGRKIQRQDTRLVDPRVRFKTTYQTRIKRIEWLQKFHDFCILFHSLFWSKLMR
jgi:hypothetical protein